MIFKKIELIGFKSFADKTEITFDGGITAIVGPNGCGKSNVADAIRWVLGEQSSKTLRGSNMQDVIFNGTEKRKSLSYCEVALYFDNTDRTFNLDYNEVVISRKLYRSGESEYAINRQECRLKEIVAILHDVGIGREGYSIIGQGRVEEIISSKPENRRAIFEEAAGIAKHKVKKLESERKLERNKENLNRVNDIIVEKESQLAPLEKQAETAKKYLEIKEKLKNYEVNAYIYQYERASEIKADISSRIKELVESINFKNSQIDKINLDYNSSMSELNEIDQTLNKLHEEILNITVAIEKSAGESKLFEERLNFLKEQKARFETDASNLALKISSINAEINSKKMQVLSKQGMLKKLEATGEEIRASYLQIVDALTEGEDEVDATQKQMIESLSSLADIKADNSRMQAEKEAYAKRKEELKNNLLDLNAKKLNEDSKLNEAKKALDQSEKVKAVFIAECDTKNKEIQSLSAQCLEKDASVSGLLERRSSLESRLKLLVEMQAENEGYAFSVRKLLEAGKNNAEIKKLIEGTVAEKFKTDEKFETAIEMALGSAIQNIITVDEENAKKLIEFLKVNNFGRATMLPITSVKPRNIESRFNAEISKLSFGVALNLIKFDNKYGKVFESLLGGVVICENLDKAILLSKNCGYSFKIVTLDGDVINPQGSLTGGSKKSNGTSLITREREIGSVRETLNDVKTKLDKEISLKTELKVRLDALKTDYEKLIQKLNVAEIDAVKNHEACSRISEYIEILSKNRIGIETDIANCDKKITELEININAVTKTQQQTADGKEEANASIEKRQKQFENLKLQRDSYNENITNNKVQISATESEILALNNDVARLQTEVENNTEAQLEALESVKKAEKAIFACSSASLTLTDKEKIRESEEKLDDVKTKLSSLDLYKKQKQELLTILEEDRLKLNAELSKVMDKKFTEEVNLSRVDSDIESMQERVWEEYELTYTTAVNYKEENFDFNAGMVEINKFKKEIARLGNVNVNAIEDSRDIRIKYNEYVSEREDLLKAEADIKKIIKDLEGEMTGKFEEAFNVIQLNFTKIFRELFGGGNARLVLEDAVDGDPLSAGIEIVAEPPGKKLQSITLLSGGEKALTAIAILFAILKLRPMPFCLLDEIEAALDDANVGRFASYLKRFAETTQFIVITHRKPTMELADSLYGVTMEEKGVSKMVSVKLNEAAAQGA